MIEILMFFMSLGCIFINIKDIFRMRYGQYDKLFGD